MSPSDAAVGVSRYPKMCEGLSHARKESRYTRTSNSAHALRCSPTVIAGTSDHFHASGELGQIMFKKVLVPLDRSLFAEQALAEAKNVASGSHAAIHLVLVHQPVPFAGFEDVPWYADEAAAEADYLERITRQLAGSSVPVTSAVVKGDPAEMICGEAARNACDLIVMTSHGRTGFNRFWLGSVANAVIRHSPVPVLLIRSADDADTKEKPAPRIEKILVTLDGSRLAEAITDSACELARSHGAAVTLLRVVQAVPFMPPATSLPLAFSPVVYNEDLTKDLVRAAEGELEAVRNRFKDTVTTIDAHVITAGSVAPAILDFAESSHVDLIAMSTHGRGASRMLFGSVADKILRGSALPMLLRCPLDSPGDGHTNDQRRIT